MTLFKRLRDTFLVVVLLALPFFFLRASIRKPEELNAVDRAMLRIAAPLQYAAAAVSRAVSNVVSQYVYLVDVKSDNDRLVYENARLRAAQKELAQSNAEIRRLRRLLGLRDTIQHETVSALVVGKDTTEYFRVWHLTVDAPTGQLRPNMPVISLDGAVGTVLRDVYLEKTEPSLTYGRQIATYALLVGIPYETGTGRFSDILVTDHGYRSLTGVPVPFHVPSAKVKELEALPGIGKKRAVSLKVKRPRSLEEFSAIVGDPAIVQVLAPHLTF